MHDIKTTRAACQPLAGKPPPEHPMSPCVQNPLPSRAFTLLEMLATVAVIGVLTAILTPVIGRTLQGARSAKCLSNLRNMGPAFQAYAADNDGRYPLAYNYTSDAPDNTWMYHLAPYLGLNVTDWPSMWKACDPNGPLGCPLMKQKPFPGTPFFSYKMTQAHRIWRIFNEGFSPIDPEPNWPGLRTNLITRPSKSLLVAEGGLYVEFDSWAPEGQNVGGLSYPHNGRTNALFADGHVAAFTPAEMQANWDEFFTHAVQ